LRAESRGYGAWSQEAESETEFKVEKIERRQKGIWQVGE